MAEFGRRKKKVCMMCTGATVDYKNPETLKRYVNEKGKIVSRRVTGNCARHQRIIRVPCELFFHFTNERKYYIIRKKNTGGKNEDN